MIKVSEFEEITSVNDNDIMEVSKYNSSDFDSFNIDINQFRNSLGATPHTIQSHTDTNATGSQLNTLTDGSNADSLHVHDFSHNIQSHTDTNATGSQLDTLTNGSNADSLHSHNTDHTIQSHTDTNATGSQLDTLTNGSNADSLHSHNTDHTIQSHTDTNITASQLNTLTDGSNADNLHNHTLSSINYSSVIQPGTIVCVPYSVVPSGWLECDGSELSKTSYLTLYTTLKNNGSGCIYGETSTTFKIPDYRGAFLRSTSNGSINDPDASSRTDRGDGTVGDSVGTKQEDQFVSHNHGICFRSTNRNGGTSGDDVLLYSTSGTRNTLAYGGNETRPINIALMYIIKI